MLGNDLRLNRVEAVRGRSAAAENFAMDDPGRETMLAVLDTTSRLRDTDCIADTGLLIVGVRQLPAS